jgi:hypothetical protein
MHPEMRFTPTGERFVHKIERRVILAVFGVLVYILCNNS